MKNAIKDDNKYMKRYLLLFLIIPFLLSCGAGGGGGSNENGSGDGGDNSTLKTNPLCTSVSKSAKIRIKKDGVYRISYTDLYNSCLDFYGVDINSLKMTNQVEEIAIEVIDNDSNGILTDTDYIDFYGRAISREDDSFRYTDTNVYWLFTEDGIRKRIGKITSNSEATQPPESFLKVLHLEEDSHYVQGITNYPSLTEHWFWGDVFNTPGFICNVPPDECRDDIKMRYEFIRDYSFNTSYVDESKDVSFTIRLQSVSGSHHIKVSVNNNLILEKTWSDAAPFEIEGQFSSSFLKVDDSNYLTIESVGDTPSGIFDFFYLDWFEISYNHKYQAEYDNLEFTGKDYIEALSSKVDGIFKASIEKVKADGKRKTIGAEDLA
jgi:hypothetical protein